MGGCAGDPQVVNHHESCCGGYGCSSGDAYSMNITKMNRHGLAYAPRNALALTNKTIQMNHAASLVRRRCYAMMNRRNHSESSPVRGLCLARSISARSIFRAIAPTTLAVT
jgi:hypothetical protein